jgi:hypothetical protein
LINEFKRRLDEPVRMVIGAPIARDMLDDLKSDPTHMMEALRRHT